jgi:tetratricopeptide (TPR) repeat protein
MNEHVRKAVLARYRLNPESVHDRQRVEEHLQECDECRLLLEDMRALEAGLSDPEAWAGDPDDAGLAQLRRLATGGPAEDREAETLLADFDKAPAARFAFEDLPNDVRYHTGGVVRALCRRANAMCGRDPRYALALANAANRIATVLSAERYPAKAVHAWRGEAHKERANALYLLGRFPEVLKALDDAEREFDQTGHVGIGHVAVQYIRANVLYEQDDAVNARRLAEESAAAALHLGDEDRFVSARYLSATIRFESDDFAGAIRISEEVLGFGEKTRSPVWIARASLTLGNCQIELGNLRDARRRLEVALRRFTESEFDGDVTKTRWALARLSFAEGAASDAMQRMRAVIAELTTLEMLTDAAIASVDLAEMLYFTGRARDIPRVLGGVVETFTNAGKLTGALTALAYLREAASAGTLTRRVTRDVRRFLGRTEYQPQLVFVPPPPEV